MALSPDEFADVLLERQTAWIAREHPSGLRAPWVRPLLTWFIQDGDEHLVDMDQIHQANRAEDEQAKPSQPARVSEELIRARLRSNQCKLTGAEKRLTTLTASDRDDNAVINIPFAKRRGSLDRQIQQVVQVTKQISLLRHKIGLDVARLGRLTSKGQHQ